MPFYQLGFLQSAACNARHDAEQRLARWILTLADRSGERTLPFTHHHIAEMLGRSQAEPVTLAARLMQSAGLIEYRRGMVDPLWTVPASIIEVACECYGVIRLFLRQRPESIRGKSLGGLRNAAVDDAGTRRADGSCGSPDNTRRKSAPGRVDRSPLSFAGLSPRCRQLGGFVWTKRHRRPADSKSHGEVVMCATDALLSRSGRKPSTTSAPFALPASAILS